MPFGSMSRSQGRALFPAKIVVNNVLLQTYFLFSLTLLFSALTAFFSMTTNAAPLPGLIQIVGMLGLLFLTMALRNSVWGLVSIFAFTGFTGYTLGPVMNMYISTFTNGSQLIMTSLGATGTIFLGLSGYVLTTKKDFSYLGGFLFIALLGGFVLLLASLLFQLPMLHIAMCALFVVIFSFYIFFYTNPIFY